MARKSGNMWVFLVVLILAYALIPDVRTSIDSFFGETNLSAEGQDLPKHSSPWSEELLYNMFFILIIVASITIFVVFKRRKNTTNKNKRKKINQQNVKANKKDI